MAESLTGKARGNLWAVGQNVLKRRMTVHSHIAGLSLLCDYFFKMFTKSGDKRVRSALKTFLTKAAALAAKAGLCSAQDRLAAFQDIEVTSENGSTYDDYFGDCPCLPDETQRSNGAL